MLVSLTYRRRAFSGFECPLCPVHITKMECLKRSFHQDALGLGLLIFIDKFCRLCSPCPVLASERSFPLPCFFLISGLPRFFGRLAQSFGKGMLMFWYRHLSHWKPLVMIMKTEFFLLFCPLQMIPSLSPPPRGIFVSRQQSEATWCIPLISALKRQRQVDFFGPSYWVLCSGPAKAAQ